jgi:predicted transcriptional regulator
MAVAFNTVTIGVSTPEEARARSQRAFVGREQGAFISFASVELLWKVMTPKRWEILRAITAAGPVSIREISRRVGRDVKSVHGDVTALLKAGVVERAEDGRVIFPYDEIHVDFVLRAA